MHLVCETLDDALRDLYPRLLEHTEIIVTSRGDTRESLGVLIEIEKPRARLSRTETRCKPFSCLGELLWYLTRDNKLDFIVRYIRDYENESEDGITVYGGYGARLFGQRHENQIENVIRLLCVNPLSRRAVIQLFNAEDISHRYKEIPCTTTMQFIIRHGRLNMLTNMRSNDAFIGLPHDIFCFTMIQEIIACSLGCQLGIYKHFVGSMHLYETCREEAEQYLSEAVQPRIEMPPMPEGDPWSPIRRLLDAEHRIRSGEMIDAGRWGVGAYWADLIRLLQIFEATGDEERINALKSEMAFKPYGPYIDSRKMMKPRKPQTPAQPSLKH